MQVTRQTRYGMLTALLIGMALLLAGCGGDNGVDQGMHDTVVAERDAAQAAQAAAEAEAAAEAQAKEEAEAAAAAAAEEARMAAEARIKAEAEAAAAAAAEMEAEEEARMEAEAAAKAAEEAAAAMKAAEEAEAAAMKAEEEAAAAMKAAEEAETQAAMDEAARMTAEMERDALEAADTAQRADSIVESMGMFIADEAEDNAARTVAGTDVDGAGTVIPGADDGDYDPSNVPTTQRVADAGAADPNLDPMTSMYGDEAVDKTPLGTSANDLKADVSVGQKMRPKTVNAPALSGVSLKYSAGEITATASPPRGDEFAVVGYVAQDAEPPAIAGWDGGVLMRRDDVDNADQMLYYYTDIAAATGVSFLVKYKATQLGVTNDNIGKAASLTFPSVGGDANNLVLIGQRPATDTVNSDLLRLTDQANHVAFAGTFDGVAGTFACTGICVVEYDPDDGSRSFRFGEGTPTGITATGADAIRTAASTAATATAPDTNNFLTFVADDPTASVAGINNEHLVFGYWLHKPSNPAADHHFMPFASGMAAFDVRGDDPAVEGTQRDDATRAADRTPEVSLVHLLTGPARFKGPAAGKYVTREVLGQSAMIGQFTATAELIADFDADMEPRDATAAPGAITGIVQDFKDANGEPLSNWHVTLGGASLTAIGAAPGINEGPDRMDSATPADSAVRADNTFNSRTEAGMSTTQFNGATNARLGGASIDGIGRWVGQFYGNGRSDGKPNAVVGVFDARAGHASVSGAFGAYNTTAE